MGVTGFSDQTLSRTAMKAELLDAMALSTFTIGNAFVQLAAVAVRFGVVYKYVVIEMLLVFG